MTFILSVVISLIVIAVVITNSVISDAYHAGV